MLFMLVDCGLSCCGCLVGFGLWFSLILVGLVNSVGMLVVFVLLCLIILLLVAGFRWLFNVCFFDVLCIVCFVVFWFVWWLVCVLIGWFTIWLAAWVCVCYIVVWVLLWCFDFDLVSFWV